MTKIANALMLLSSVLLIGYTTPSFADELVTTVKKGEEVPFDGTLFNTEAAARLTSELEFADAACQIKIDRAVSATEIAKQADIDALRVQLLTCETLSEQRIQIRDDQIDFLTTELANTKRPVASAWFAGGVVAGIGLTVLSGWAIGQAAGR